MEFQAVLRVFRNKGISEGFFEQGSESEFLDGVGFLQGVKSSTIAPGFRNHLSGWPRNPTATGNRNCQNRCPETEFEEPEPSD